MKLLSQNKIKAIGIMSGTSLDGLDLVAAEFWHTDGKWNFNILAAETFSYSTYWIQKLKHSPYISGEKLIELHAEYGRFLGNAAKQFTEKNVFQAEIISSHGHTVFHQPEKGFTFQAGNGFEITAITGITTVADFRSGDVALGGQGAPLVPVGDKLLFSEYDFCLNLGGFANISFEQDGKRIAFDICPVNIILNHFAEKQGFALDSNGELGRKGTVNFKLLKQLNQLGFYKTTPPKSLGREWVEQVFMPVLDNFDIADEDKLRTVYEHISQQIAFVVSKEGTVKMLVTGGGTLNSFLVELISKKTAVKLVIPEKEIVNFKEALIFAFLGVLKIQGQINCLASATGASCDHSTGIIFHS